MGKYIDNEGYVYESYEEYCNSPDIDKDKIGVLLSLGRRTPQNDFEKKLLEEIIELKKKGNPIEFDFN